MKGLKYLSLAGAVPFYVASVGFEALLFNSLVSKRIKSQQELERVIGEESRELGLDPSKIEAVIWDDCHKIGVSKHDETYRITMAPNSFCTVATLRKSLYDIYKGYIDHDSGFLREVFIEEPRALLYALK